MTVILTPARFSSSSRSSAFQWKRNQSWLALPTVLGTEQRIVGLYAIYPSPADNFIAFTISGNYTVDWGDGSGAQNYTSGQTAANTYSFNNSALNNTHAPATFTDAGDLVTRTSHGFLDGDFVTFATISGTTGVVAGEKYYVINATANTFQVSASSGGSPINLVGNGVGTLLPYKIAIVTITPQSGQTLTSVNLNVRHPTASQAYSAAWLDVTLSAPSITSLVIGGTTVPFRYLERIQILSHAVTNMASMFNGCTSLQSVPLFNTAAVTSMASMFVNCSSLQSVPLFNTAAVTNMTSMFSGCFSLQSVPLFNTAAVTSMASMFVNCTSLQSVPLFNTAAVTSMASMFNGCTSLQSVPLFNTAAVTSMASMFSGCFSLQSVPLFNTAAVTNMTGMFVNCSSLQSVQASNISVDVSFANCNLSAAALNMIYSNLATVVGRTITVSGNYGTNADNPTIATAKGWMVVG